jgi:hypothetical protein
MKVELHKLFYTPVWRFHYPDFENDQEYFVRYLAQDNLYISEREKNGLQITRANLHKDHTLKKLTEFIHSCSKYAMNDMGYLDSCGITSMWATRQKPGGFHHMHSHGNSFLGGSFHMFDVDGSASGTVFPNLSAEKYVLQPARSKKKELMLKSHEEMKFVPGTLIMFPAWATHQTSPTNCQYRIIVGVNVMPIGKTNTDHFDRYNFPETQYMRLMEYGDE